MSESVQGTTGSSVFPEIMRSRERKMGPERVEMPRPWRELNATVDIWPKRETAECVGKL